MFGSHASRASRFILSSFIYWSKFTLFTKYFKLILVEVRRDHAIRDALFQLEGKSTSELRKQLRVSFVGEEGVDEGGVQKEFFQIVVKDMVNSSYGMFFMQEDSREYWLCNDGVNDEETIKEFNLLGRLIGLAIYNGVILDISFPMALYKKLLRFPLDIEDLKEFDPLLGRGMEQLLEFEGDVSEFERTFQVDYVMTDGTRSTMNLKENGQDVAVDNSNRKGILH